MKESSPELSTSRRMFISDGGNTLVMPPTPRRLIAATYDGRQRVKARKKFQRLRGRKALDTIVQPGV